MKRKAVLKAMLETQVITESQYRTAVGQPLSETTIQQDVRDLINTGYFADVRVSREPVEGGVKVVYQVRGKATIKEVSMEDIVRGSLPFVLLLMMGLVVIMVFPMLATWLPGRMGF